MSIPEPDESPRIRRLLLQPGMLLLFLLVCLGWAAVAVWGNGGLLADMTADAPVLTPLSGNRPLEPADTVESGVFATLTVSTPGAPATLRPDPTRTSPATAPSGGRLSDFLNGTRTP